MTWPTDYSCQSVLTWPRDEDGLIALFKIPEQISLALQKSPTDTNTTTGASWRGITNLPQEIQDLIIAHLLLVDRICLGLTCKGLASAVLSTPRLTPEAWYDLMNGRHDAEATKIYQLRQRLAHGWVPKSELRYCWRCSQIRTRSPSFWRSVAVGKTVQGKFFTTTVAPVWSTKLAVAEATWNGWDTRTRYEYIISLWCDAPWEDSSVIACDSCRPRLFEAAQLCKNYITARPECIQHYGCEAGCGLTWAAPESRPSRWTTFKAAVSFRRTSRTDPEKQTATGRPQRSDSDRNLAVHPVQCPICLAAELTHGVESPRKCGLVKALFSFFRAVATHCVLAGSWLLFILLQVALIPLKGIAMHCGRMRRR